MHEQMVRSRKVEVGDKGNLTYSGGTKTCKQKQLQRTQSGACDVHSLGGAVSE